MIRDLDTRIRNRHYPPTSNWRMKKRPARDYELGALRAVAAAQELDRWPTSRTISRFAYEESRRFRTYVLRVLRNARLLKSRRAQSWPGVRYRLTWHGRRELARLEKEAA